MINSRNKGKRGELEVVSLLKTHGYSTARRTFGQARGGAECPDVECEEFGYWIEVKLGNLDPGKAHIQASADAAMHGDIRHPVVFSRRNGEDWLVTIDALEFLKLLGSHETLQSILRVRQGAGGETN